MRSATYVLAALAAGFVLGSLAAATSSPIALRLVSIIEPLGTLWVNAIRMTVVPLVVSVLITGVATGFGSRSLGRMGARALVTYAILLVVAGLIALAIAPPLLARIPLTPDVADRLRASATTAAASTVTAVQQLPSLAQRIVDTVPANPIRAAADGAMLPLVVFTLVMALGIARLAQPVRDTTRRKRARSRTAAHGLRRADLAACRASRFSACRFAAGAASAGSVPVCLTSVLSADLAVGCFAANASPPPATASSAPAQASTATSLGRASPPIEHAEHKPGC